ncbi:hypothetical protein BCL93_105118 [Onishia taeanensis]|uniref:Uncharacterized protein n=1 Tax=Onishia taeanensis TaxID=284577 RepID=A0A328XW43_9GAMM|nr:hypothetical protein [Halomonas taeanensis]RAR61517.1 hypothetical protein BCL93_105118 [Halomonas taeanensis]
MKIEPMPGISIEKLNAEAEEAERLHGISRARYIAQRLGQPFSDSDSRAVKLRQLADKEL